MATANQDSIYDGVTLDVTLDEGALRNACVPEAIIQALQTARFRVNLPRNAGSRAGVSTLPDNLARLDSEGLIYVPAMLGVQIAEQTLVLGATIAPGVQKEMSLPVPGIADLAAALKNIEVTVSPPDAGVNMTPWVAEGSTLKAFFSRIDDGSSAPYQEITIRVKGQVYSVPQPQTPTTEG